MFISVFAFIVRLSTCVAVVDVEYSFKYSYEGQSDHKGDAFGASLSTFNHKLVIGAPGYNNHRGSITVMPDGLQVRGPAGGKWFGGSVDMNQEFMVVSGYPDMFVYKSSSPYNMVAMIPIGGCSPVNALVIALVISDDNTIAILHEEDNSDFWLTIYQYDGSESWHIAQKFDLESRKPPEASLSLAVHRDILVVGVPGASDDHGQVRVYNRVHGQWVHEQTIKQDGVKYFGCSVAMYEHHMAVSAFHGNVFTYKLDEYTNTWVGNGRLSVTSDLNSYLHLQKNILAINFNNRGKYPDVCGAVYQLSTATMGVSQQQQQ